MDMEHGLTKRKRGQQLQNAERLVLIAKLVELLSAGYMSTYALQKRLKISKATIETYRPLADKLIGEQRLERNVIRNLQIRRTYKIIEDLMMELKGLKGVKYIKERTLVYAQIYKFSSHLALITGLNIETHVNIDPTKLVIIRPAKRVEDRITIEEQIVEAESK